MKYNWLLVIFMAGHLAGQAPGQPINPQIQQTIDEYADLIREHPDEPMLHYNVGNLLYHSGEYEQALQEYRNAINAGDRVAQSNIYYNLGNSLYRAGKYEESKAFFRRALELIPGDDDARINYELSRLQQMQEEQQEAEQESPAKDQEQENEEQGESDQAQDQGASNQQDQSETGDEQQEGDQEDQRQNPAEREESPEQSQSQLAGEAEELEREEAEAILNALRQNEEDLIQRTYKPQGNIKLEKDW